MAVRPDLANVQGSEKLSAPAYTFTPTEIHASSDSSGAILVPDAKLLFGGDYKQSGLDLILSKDGHEFTIHDYFRESRHADLRSPDGAWLRANIVDALTLGHTEYAQAGATSDPGAKVIGQVTKLTGSATAIRNGVAVELHVGDNVFIGGNTAVHQFCHVGRLALLSGCSCTTKDMPPFVIQQGIDCVSGLNLIGMKRAGMTLEQINAVRQAFRILFREGLPLPAALERLDQELGQTESVREMIAFLQKCPRGINLMRSRGREEAA